MILPAEGLEPTHSCEYWILSPARLPFRHAGVFETERKNTRFAANLNWRALSESNVFDQIQTLETSRGSENLTQNHRVTQTGGGFKKDWDIDPRF